MYVYVPHMCICLTVLVLYLSICVTCDIVDSDIPFETLTYVTLCLYPSFCIPYLLRLKMSSLSLI